MNLLVTVASATVMMATAITLKTDDPQLTITSPAFKTGGSIPAKYTCDGDNINPALSIKGIPASAKSLVITVHDPDAGDKGFDHWVVWNITPTENIKENSIPGVTGKNSAGKNAYTGPCPPSGSHHYNFKVYALDVMLDLSKNSDISAVEKAMKGHVLASGELSGMYQKEKQKAAGLYNK